MGQDSYGREGERKGAKENDGPGGRAVGVHAGEGLGSVGTVWSLPSVVIAPSTPGGLFMARRAPVTP